MRRRLLWGLIALLAGLVIISAGYRSTIFYLERQQDDARHPTPQYQRLIETRPS